MSAEPEDDFEENTMNMECKAKDGWTGEELKALGACEGDCQQSQEALGLKDATPPYMRQGTCYTPQAVTSIMRHVQDIEKRTEAERKRKAKYAAGLPTDSQERKTWPMFTGLLKYFPDALAAIAHHSWVSNEKHNPGEPTHWSKGKSDDHRDCIVRHLTDLIVVEEKYGELSDEAEYELKAMAWRANAELQVFYDKRRKANGQG